jgi:hypothetical protein
MWAHILNALLGVWVMVAPAVLGYTGTALSTAHRIIGPLIVTFAVIAWWEETRLAGHANVLTGVALIIVPLLIGSGTGALINSIVVGVVVAALALVRGTYRPETFGGGWSVLWYTDRLPRSGKPHDEQHTG